MPVKEMIFGILGGLGLFIFGMRLMSEGLQKAAGERIRQILEFLTNRPVKGILAGAGVTALIQSSSATTVMTVGLVNAGLLTLAQAISVVMGANIGTTVTAQLIAFKITQYALPAIGIGLFIHLFAKNKKVKLWGQVLLGFGLLFLGLLIMKQAFSPLQGSQQAKDFFVSFSRQPILGVIAGALITMLIQSSSATIGLTMALAAAGLIDFTGAISLVLGENIGTTVTAQIASIGTNLNARRTAMAHVMFNVIGVCYMLPLLYLGLYQKLIAFITPGVTLQTITPQNILRPIANAHTVFNLFNTFVVFLPLIAILERITVRLIPGEPEVVGGRPIYLEKHLLDSPPIALDQTTKEIIRMTGIAKKSISEAMCGFIEGKSLILEKVASKEDAIDNLQKEITQYLVKISQRDLSEEESGRLPVLMHTVNDVERIGDHAENIAELAQRKIDEKLPFSNDAISEIKMFYVKIEKMIDLVIEGLSSGDVKKGEEALKIEEEINNLQFKLRQNHIERLNKGKCFILSGIIFLDIIANLEKIGDHLTNIAEAVCGSLRWRMNSKEAAATAEPTKI